MVDLSESFENHPNSTLWYSHTPRLLIYK